MMKVYPQKKEICRIVSTPGVLRSIAGSSTGRDELCKATISRSKRETNCIQMARHPDDRALPSAGLRGRVPCAGIRGGPRSWSSRSTPEERNSGRRSSIQEETIPERAWSRLRTMGSSSGEKSGPGARNSPMGSLRSTATVPLSGTPPAGVRRSLPSLRRPGAPS